jgi:hypothetical protein
VRVNVTVIVPVTRGDKINLSMSTTSDFEVQIENSMVLTIGLPGNGRF